MFIRNLIEFILSNFRTVYVFESKKNKRYLKYKNFNLRLYNSFNSIKDQKLKKYLVKEKKIERFKIKQTLVVLFHKKNCVSTGWLYQGFNWHISEIGKKIDIKKKVLLFDFFTFSEFRNKGYYCKILRLIKNIKTKKTFLIYCLKNNKASKIGILNSGFKLKGKLSKYV